LSAETVDSVPSPDCESRRLNESEDRDRFEGGRLMSSWISHSSLGRTLDSHFSINAPLADGSKGERALFADGCSVCLSGDLIFRSGTRELVGDNS